MIRWKLLTTPFATRNTLLRSGGGLFEQHFTEWYVFGFRVAQLHRNQAR